MRVTSGAFTGSVGGRTIARGVRPARRRFQTTRKSLIAGLRRDDRQIALPALCEAYRAPLVDFLRARGCQPADADDAVQGLLLSTMRPGFFATFDPSRGKFRSWLSKAAYRFSLRRRAASPAAVNPDRVMGRHGEGDVAEAERAVERARWITAVCERALERLRERYAAADQTELFWEAYAAVMGERRMTDDAARARRLGRSAGALKQAKHKEKAAWTLAYHGCLREELAAHGVKRVDMTRIMREMLDVFR